MKLIIDIDEKAYKDGQLCNFFRCYSEKLDEIIYNGIPLEHIKERIKSISTEMPCIDCETLTCISKRDKTAKEIKDEILSNIDVCVEEAYYIVI